MSMMIKFYLTAPGSNPFINQTPWKTIAPPSGIDPFEYFFGDPQCELNCEDDAGFLFIDDKPVAYKNGCDSSTVSTDIKDYWGC